jgi:predicted DNA-binding antitoxin AbrB/MazE fold protein
MTTKVEAIYEQGTLRPLRALSLPEGARVELVVKTPDGATSKDRPKRSPAEGLAEIAAGSVQHGTPETASRDHDRFLYGTRDPK